MAWETADTSSTVSRTSRVSERRSRRRRRRGSSTVLSDDSVERDQIETDENDEVLVRTEVVEKDADEVNGSFFERLRSLYKDSIVNVKGNRIRLNVAEFNRVTLECSQKRLVDLIFKFVHEIEFDNADESEVQEFTDEAEQCIEDYGKFHPCTLSTPWSPVLNRNVK